MAPTSKPLAEEQGLSDDTRARDETFSNKSSKTDGLWGDLVQEVGTTTGSLNELGAFLHMLDEKGHYEDEGGLHADSSMGSDDLEFDS